IAGDNGTILKTINGGLTGIENSTMRESDLVVYPNPTTGNLTISNSDMKINYLDITDETGKSIYKSKHVSNNEQINISTFNSGLYLVALYDVERKVIKTFKIIKK